MYRRIGLLAHDWIRAVSSYPVVLDSTVVQSAAYVLCTGNNSLLLLWSLWTLGGWLGRCRGLLVGFTHILTQSLEQSRQGLSRVE